MQSFCGLKMYMPLELTSPMASYNLYMQPGCYQLEKGGVYKQNMCLLQIVVSESIGLQSCMQRCFHV